MKSLIAADRVTQFLHLTREKKIHEMNWAFFFFFFLLHVSILETGPRTAAGLKANKEGHCLVLKIVFRAVTSDFLRTDNNQPFTLEHGGEREKRNEKAVVGIALSRKKDSLLSVNGASSLFLTRIDIARIFNSFFFERQQCFI